VRYWINTVSRNHVLTGIEGGFTQAQHGSPAGLRRLARGDRVLFYAPRTEYPDGPPLRRFVAVGEVVDDAPYQVEMTPDFHPWRRNLSFLPCTEAEIEPLIAGLEFIADKKRWGFPFRRGLFEIGAGDYARIARALGVET
jgi:hypothetical protein